MTPERWDEARGWREMAARIEVWIGSSELFDWEERDLRSAVDGCKERARQLEDERDA